MGKGYHNYMSKKFFHPGNFENIKRVWMAQQKDAHEKKADEDLLAQYQKEQEMYQNRALLGDEKAKLGLNFMYDPPPGVKREREKEEDEPEYKFEWQRKYNAPRESYAKGDDTVRDQPFGIEVRNVRCLKCRKWGHINTDKICPFFGNSITAEPPQTADNNPGELMEQMKEEGLAFTKKVLSRQNDPGASNQQMVDSDAEADEEIAFFLTLNRKERKKLVKKLEKERKKDKKERRKLRKRKLEARLEKENLIAEAKKAENEQESKSRDEDEPRKPYQRQRRKLSGDDSDEPKSKNPRSESPSSRRANRGEVNGRGRSYRSGERPPQDRKEMVRHGDRSERRQERQEVHNGDRVDRRNDSTREHASKRSPEHRHRQEGRTSDRRGRRE